MDLQWVKIKGFRRFESETTLRIFGRLVALVGPNEAGKTTVLLALAYLGNDNPIESLESSRGKPIENTKLEANFFLNKNELKQAKLKKSTRFIVKKNITGDRDFELSPRAPLRSFVKRRNLVKQINKILLNENLLIEFQTSNPNLIAQLKNLVSQIDNTQEEDLQPNVVNQIISISETLIKHLPDSAPKYAHALHNKAKEFAAFELKQNPTTSAINILKNCIPPVLSFSDEHRLLKSNYDLAKVAASTPAPLQNLIEIAKLDLKKLLTEFQKNDTAECKNVLVPANRNLAKTFSTAWTQTPLGVEFALEGPTLKIYIKDKDEKFSNLGERSDGLRQFVALYAFTKKNYAKNPILLIDEAERHLHYDGQADLIQMLTRQKIAEKIIYTTHSAGCLPEDLGVGVALVVPDVDHRTSAINSKCWSSTEPGFTPLLFGMGANTLAFFPVRYAVVAEGQTEMLLLPTIFRQVSEREFLGFQVVSGLSETTLSVLPAMETAGKRVVYFVDADNEGNLLKKKLKKLNVENDRIYSMRRPTNASLTIEDLIDADCFVKATNRVIDEFYSGKSHVTTTDVSSPNRVDKLNAFCTKNNIKEIPKINIAYHLLDIAAEGSGVLIFEQKFKSQLESIYEKIIKVLNINI